MNALRQLIRKVKAHLRREPTCVICGTPLSKGDIIVSLRGDREAHFICALRGAKITVTGVDE